ncbi:hypothetical protein OG989_05625 [Micromonospora sp. NBC_01740]|uniref:hypothetical protein n=1 Tax=Micromonospora sp. NBC_01740 TaxID=2975986 RepID=UPI002E1173CD|nr:hypothetical protein OG989_05625 [Micromonospora sp. NBC_01740]
MAEFGGFRVDAVFWTGRDGLLVALKFHGIPDSSTTISLTAAIEGDPTGLVRRLENQLTDLDSTRDTVQARIAQQQDEIDRAVEQLDQPFPRRAELLDTRRRLRAINAVIDLMAAPPPPTPSVPPAVPVTVTDWMPADLREGLTPDEQSWLERRVQNVAGDRAVQQAARTTDLPTFAAAFDTALSHALADPGSTEMAVAVMLRCDEPDWRHALYSAAGQAVHQVVRAALPPAPAASTAPPQRDVEPDQPQPVSPMTPAAIVAATTQADRALLDACTRQAVRVDHVQTAARSGDEAAFAAAFTTAMTTAIGQLDDPADVERLTELHGNEAFRDGLAQLVWSKLTPLPHVDQDTVPDSRPADAAAVAATAFPTATTAVPTAASTRSAASAVHRPAPTAEPESAR